MSQFKLHDGITTNIFFLLLLKEILSENSFHLTQRLCSCRSEENKSYWIKVFLRWITSEYMVRKSFDRILSFAFISWKLDDFLRILQIYDKNGMWRRQKGQVLNVCGICYISDVRFNPAKASPPKLEVRSMIHSM